MKPSGSDNSNTAAEFTTRGLEKIFGLPNRLTVLKGVDLTIKKGEMIAIVGKSGTGKTTLMQILGTLDRPTAGEVLFNGENVFAKNDVELSAFRNRTIGFVFQSHHLLPEFTALENTIMPGLIAGINKKDMLGRGVDILEKVGLADRTEHKVGELSGGEQQRVALARALILKPALLLADEPTGNLDPVTGGRVFELIQAMNREYSLATVMVTHNYELAARMDRCLTLENGRLHDKETDPS